MAGSSEDDDAKDIDRAAILARRRMMIMSSLAGLTVACTGPDRASPRPCLQVAGKRSSDEDVERALVTKLKRLRRDKAELQRALEQTQDANEREGIRGKIKRLDRHVAELEDLLGRIDERGQDKGARQAAGESRGPAGGAGSSD